MDGSSLVVRRPVLRLSAFTIALALPMACATHPGGSDDPGTSPERSAPHEAVLATEGPIDNRVPGHAPDSLVEVEQGYILPSRSDGRRQSPIDIMTYDVELGSHEVAAHYEASHERIRNLGHTIQLDYDSGSYIDFEGERYDLVQFHYHTPSEHRIDGMTFPLEIHLVHRRREEPDGVPHYLVIGGLYKCGATNPFLQKILDEVPEGEDETAESAEVLIHVNEVLAEELKRFYHYTGSLTTPPFTETVDWLVLQRIFEASPEQIAFLNRIEGNNARHVHALDGRTVDAEGLDR